MRKEYWLIQHPITLKFLSWNSQGEVIWHINFVYAERFNYEQEARTIAVAHGLSIRKIVMELI